MSYATKVAADGATSYWPLDDAGSFASTGTASSSADPFGGSFDSSKAIDGSLTTGWAISAALCNGSWWQETWGGSISSRGCRIRARDSANATAGVDNNPVGTWSLSDSSSGSFPAIAVNGEYCIDFGGTKTFTWLKLTFTAGAPGGGNPGWSDVQLNVMHDAIGTNSVVEHAGSSLTYSASGPSSISGSAGVTVPAADGSYLFGPAPSITGNADRTMEFWAKTTRSGAACPFAFGDATANQLSAAILNTDGSVTDDLIFSANKGGSDVSNKSVTAHAQRDGSWHHIAIVWDAATHAAEFFFDGTSVGSDAMGSNINTVATGLSIGALFISTGFYLDGTISNVAVYSSKLTSAQIADHATGDTGSTSAAAENAAGTGAASTAAAALSVNAGASSGTGNAYGPSQSVIVNGGLASGTASAYDATVSTANNVSASAGAASGTGAAYGPSRSIAPHAGVGSGTGAAYGGTAVAESRRRRGIIGRHLRASGVFGGFSASSSSGSSLTCDTFTRTGSGDWGTSEIPNATWESIRGTWSTDGSQGVVVTAGSFNRGDGDLNFSSTPFPSGLFPVDFTMKMSWPASGFASFEFAPSLSDFDMYLERNTTDLTAEMLSPAGGPVTIISSFGGGELHWHLRLEDTQTTLAVWDTGAEPAPQITVSHASGFYVPANLDFFNFKFTGSSTSTQFTADDFCLGD